MNKDEIKKAIKCCFDYNCAECPNAKIKGYGCKDKLHADALNLITEQEKEIERLKAENEKYLDSIESVQAGRCRLRCQLTEQAVKQAKIDVLNKLKRQAEHCDQWNCEVVPTKYLDEMIEELQK